MAVFNRNVITADDIRHLKSALTGQSNVPKTLDLNPPAAAAAGGGAALPPGAPQPGAPQPGAPAPGGVAVPSADDYLTKLLKYVPLEVLGAYLFLQGVIVGNVSKGSDLSWWLGALLVGVILLSVPYDIRVLNVVRRGQIIIGVVGLLVYVFALGGWFATTTWYHQWYGSIALPLFGLLVAIFRLKPLPTS